MNIANFKSKLFLNSTSHSDLCNLVLSVFKQWKVESLKLKLNSLYFTETANCYCFSVPYNIMNIFTFRFTPKDDVKPYDIYGVTIGEVEVDLLTGQHQVSRIIGQQDGKGMYCFP
jgi:hypothetical protein